MATDRAEEDATVNPLVEKVARAIHEGLGGNGWAYTNYGGDELHSMRTELLSAARAALAAAEGAAWQPIETALRDRMIWVYAPAYEGLPEIVGPCRWHDDAGFCVDELRSPTHWHLMPSPPPSTTGDAP